MIVEFRRRTLLPLDNVFGCLGRHPEAYAVQPPPMRHGISRLPESEEKTYNAVGSQNDDRLRPHRYMRAAARRRQTQQQMLNPGELIVRSASRSIESLRQ
jgi:hypothetical protein